MVPCLNISAQSRLVWVAVSRWALLVGCARRFLQDQGWLRGVAGRRLRVAEVAASVHGRGLLIAA